jgi:hypothetical protein
MKERAKKWPTGRTGGRTSKHGSKAVKTHEQELEDLKKKVNYWINKWCTILRLQDWDVFFKISRKDDMRLEGSQATMGICEEVKNVFIEIIDPIDYNADIPQDIEMSVVHELVHVYMNEWPGKNNNGSEEHPGCASIAEEQAVNALATALVKLDRGFKYTDD